MKKLFSFFFFLCSLFASLISHGQTISNWYEQYHNADGGSSVHYWWGIYPDSNLVFSFSSGSFNSYVHGLGFSFDPTDHSYSYGPNPVLPAMPDTGQSYSLDSFYFFYGYVRNNPNPTVVDSMIIEIARTTMSRLPDSGAYNLHFRPDGSFLPWTTDPYTGYAADSTPRFSDLILDNHFLKNDCLDSCKLSSPSSKFRFAVPLNNSSLRSHVSTSGILDSIRTYDLRLATPINVKYGEHLVAYIYFKSGLTYPLGTSYSSANFLALFAGNPFGSIGIPFGQTPSNPSTGYPGSYNVGLINNNQTLYDKFGGFHDSLNHEILIPASAYTTDPLFEVPWYAFHINYCPVPVLSPIVGSSSICVGSTSTLSCSATGATSVSWSSSSTSVATVGPSSGIVNGVAAGTATITFTAANTCGTGKAYMTVTVSPSSTTSATITGPTSVVAGMSVVLSASPSGGAWSATNSNATVSGSGVVTGRTYGLDTIIYNYASACGTVSGTKTINVTPLCVGSVAAIDPTAYGLPSGGTYSSSNPSIFTVGSSSGVVTGVSAGTANITYTVLGSTVFTPLTVNPLPNAGSISGPSTVCPGSIISLGASASGGIWTSSSLSIATVSSSGVVTGVSSGVVSISYTVSNACGNAYAVKSVTVNSLPTAGSISGPTSVCTGSTITLTDGVAGGVWTSSSPSVASIISTGIVTGVAAGVATISYTTTNSCGSSYAVQAITVNALPSAGTISGSGSVCVGNTIPLTASVGGGVWSSSSSSIAVISSGGIVTGVSGGTVTISYTVTTPCGSAYTTQTVVVNPLPTAGSISGPTSVCTGSTITLTDGVPGGVWTSSSPSVASISSTGIVTGVAAGVTTISYTTTNSCGSSYAVQAITVNALPSAGTISGSGSVCVGNTIPLTASVGGGVWSSSSSSIAVISSGGIVTGVSGGTVTISYTVTTPCGSAYTTQTVVVNPLPTAGSISGPTSVCTGSTITLTDGVLGGIWTSSAGSIASVSSAGLVSGIFVGTAVITYSVSTPCGTAFTTQTVTVNPLPVAGTIIGSTSICPGDSITLTDAISGGIWTSASGAVASVSSTGIVRGVASGTTTISYSVTTGCGTASATHTVTVNSLPNAGALSGPAEVCVGSSITVVSTVSSGTWSISNASAFVSSGGVVIGSAPGTDTVYYSVTNVCGTARSSFIITVNTLPDAGLISGPDSVCLYQVIKLVESVPGGVWDELTAHTIVSSTGSVAGFVLGIDTVVYSLSNECGRSVAQKLVRVVECSNVGVQELSQETALSVFPNPNKGTFTVKGTVGLISEEKAGIEVVNMLGQTIYKSDVLKLNGELDQQVVLSDAANGMYLLKVICGNEQKIFHIMIGQ